MPAKSRFSEKLPESADYRVAEIVSYAIRIHKKERSFNFVILRWGEAEVSGRWGGESQLTCPSTIERPALG